MSWTAPPLQHLLESRLRDARLELFADGRLTDALSDGITPQFPTQLIEEKLAAAAKAGLDAIEASLRLSAAEALNACGIDPEQSRTALRSAGERLRDSAQAAQVSLPKIPSPILIALAILGAAWLVDILLYLGGELGQSAFFLLLLLEVPVALVVGFAITRERTRQHRRALNELPARICRQYIEHFSAALAQYEQSVESLMKTGTTRES